MDGKRYTEELKLKAAKQVPERGHPVAEVAGRLGVTDYSMYQSIKKHGARRHGFIQPSLNNANPEKIRKNLKAGLKYRMRRNRKSHPHAPVYVFRRHCVADLRTLD